METPADLLAARNALDAHCSKAAALWAKTTFLSVHMWFWKCVITVGRSRELKFPTTKVTGDLDQVEKTLHNATDYLALVNATELPAAMRDAGLASNCLWRSSVECRNARIAPAKVCAATPVDNPKVVSWMESNVRNVMEYEKAAQQLQYSFDENEKLNGRSDQYDSQRKYVEAVRSDAANLRDVVHHANCKILYAALNILLDKKPLDFATAATDTWLELIQSEKAKQFKTNWSHLKDHEEWIKNHHLQLQLDPAGHKDHDTLKSISDLYGLLKIEVANLVLGRALMKAGDRDKRKAAIASAKDIVAGLGVTAEPRLAILEHSS